MHRCSVRARKRVTRRSIAGMREHPLTCVTRWQIAPAVDVVERDQDYEITAELPGMDETNIEVSVLNGMLTLKGEKKIAVKSS